MVWSRYICRQTNTGFDCNTVFAKSNLSTHMGGFQDPLVGRDPQFEKPWTRGPRVYPYAPVYPYSLLQTDLRLSAFAMMIWRRRGLNIRLTCIETVNWSHWHNHGARGFYRPSCGTVLRLIIKTRRACRPTQRPIMFIIGSYLLVAYADFYLLCVIQHTIQR